MAGLTSLASALQSTIHKQKASVYLQEMEEPNDIPGTMLAFQYFPDTITDSKGVAYRNREVPGGSLPIYQWVHGGDRIVSFTSVFSCDVDLGDSQTDTLTKAATLKALGVADRNVDIRAAVVWLRRFMYPRYGDAGSSDSPITYAPRKCVLSIPNSGLGLAGCSGHGDDAVLCFMTQCEVHWVAYFPNGIPRLATVSLSFTETAQFGGTVRFPSPDEDLDALAGGEAATTVSSRGVLPYVIGKKG
jgi:hypothetical protein